MTDRSHRNALSRGYKLHWYEIKSILGQGGFGITYLAHDLNLKKDVAIKEYLPTDLATRDSDNTVHPVSSDIHSQYEWGLDRFISEARTLSKFDHPNIVRVHAVFEENNTGYMVMSYEHGQSLQSMLKGKKTLDESKLLAILGPLMDGLELVHSHDFIHRDIKPDNIFIRDDGSPALLDFGSARHSLSGQTKTLTSLVSPGYAPFEQYYSKSDEQGPWTDIYGLGATLYRAVAGRALINAVDRSKSVLDESRDTYVPAFDIGQSNYSDQFLHAIDHAIQFKPADRPQSIAEWRREFNFDEETIETKRATRVETTSTSVRQPVDESKTNIAKIVLACLFIILFAGAGYFYYLNSLSGNQEQISEVVYIEEQSEDVSSVGNNEVIGEVVNPVSGITQLELNEDERPKLSEEEIGINEEQITKQERIAEEERLAKIEEQKRVDEAQLAAQVLVEEERKKLEEEKLRLAEEQKRLEEEKQALERQKLEEERQKIEEEKFKLAEEKKRLEEDRRIAESIKLEEERQKIEEEKLKLAEEEKRLEEERLIKLALQERQEAAEKQKSEELERKIEQSRKDFASRYALKQDDFNFVETNSAVDLVHHSSSEVTASVVAKLSHWQSVGVNIKRGKTYTISANGIWRIGPLCKPTGPTGEGAYALACWDVGNQTVANRSHSALIGKIGKDSLAFYIGETFTFTADKDGTLYMMCNDAIPFFGDNTDSLDVTIRLEDSL